MLVLSVVLLWFGACGLCGVWSAPAELGALAPFAAARVYDVEGTVLLNEAQASDREVGYKLRAALAVAPVWSDAPQQHLLRFQLNKLKLYLRGKHRNAEFLPHDSVLDSHSDSTFYAHWKSGIIETAYLDPNDLTDVLNFKKSLLSVFQFQILDGEYNETDISGDCTVWYETLSEKVFRKIKRDCSSEASAAGARFRRVARYTLADALDALQALHAEEVVEPHAAEPALKARSWLALSLLPAAPAPAPAPAHASLADALLALPAALQPQSLAMEDAPPPEFKDYDSLEEALRENAAALEGAEAGAGGGAAAARAGARLPAAVRAAPRAQLAAVLVAALADDARQPRLAGVCRALGLAGSLAALQAAAAALQLRAPDPLAALAALAHTYFEGFALSDEPQEEAVLEMLRLGEEARAPALAHAALLAAAAAAPRARPAPPAPPAAAQRARDALAAGLARCKDDECKRVRLLALGNLRRADVGELMLQHAERADAATRVRLAALDALAAAPRAALTVPRLERLAELALDARAPLEVRAAALDLHVVRLAAAPGAYVHVARALHDAPHELRRVFWQRVDALAGARAAVRDVLPWMDARSRSWDGQALAGTSSVLVRETGWAAGDWRGVLESVQLARGGLLRRGTVRLHALHGDDDAFDILSVEVWTRGLEAIAGGADGDADAEDTAGGLALTVAGRRMHDISLFDGQAELVGHVWAGTASAPTPALRALVPARAVTGAARLQLGATLAYRRRGALALALDAHAQVSLWWRTARGELRLRAAAAALEEGALHAAWGRLHAAAELHAEPRLRIAADLDFYDKIALCVRVSTEDYELRSNVSLWSEQGARGRAVRRGRARAARAGGRSLSLGARADAACRALRSDDAADEP